MERIEAGTKDKWRKWLADNHLKETSVELLVYKKHTGKPSMSHREAMHEAICFGWIDTTLKRIDEDSFVRRFARRTDKSKWSDNTLRYAKQLLAEGKMSAEGIRRYEQGKARPTHDHDVPKNPEVPDDLKKALKERKGLWEKFDNMAPSKKKALLRWLYRAKMKETREKRINQIVKST